MPTMTASTSTFTPDAMTLPSTRSARKAVLLKRPNGTSTKPRERGQLELDQRDKELDRQDEEGDEDDKPGDEQDEDLDEVLEERDKAHQLTCCLKDRLAGVDPHLRDTSGLQELISRKSRSSGLQAEPRERIEDNLSEAVEVADQKGEEPNVECLADQPRDDVFIRGKRPEQTRQCNIDRDQC